MSSCPSTPIRSADLIKSLKFQVLELELSVASLRLESRNHEIDAQLLQRKLDRASELISLKDKLLAISSREHLRFMDLYLQRNADMQTLRETNETLAKKIIELKPVVYIHATGASILRTLTVVKSKRSLSPTADSTSLFLQIDPACSTPAASTPALSAVVPSPSPATLGPYAPEDA